MSTGNLVNNKIIANYLILRWLFEKKENFDKKKDETGYIELLEILERFDIYDVGRHGIENIISSSEHQFKKNYIWIKEQLNSENPGYDKTPLFLPYNSSLLGIIAEKSYFYGSMTKIYEHDMAVMVVPDDVQSFEDSDELNQLKTEDTNYANE